MAQNSLAQKTMPDLLATSINWESWCIFTVAGRMAHHLYHAQTATRPLLHLQPSYPSPKQLGELKTWELPVLLRCWMNWLYDPNKRRKFTLLKTNQRFWTRENQRVLAGFTYPLYFLIMKPCHPSSHPLMVSAPTKIIPFSTHCMWLRSQVAKSNTWNTSHSEKRQSHARVTQPVTTRYWWHRHYLDLEYELRKRLQWPNGSAVSQICRILAQLNARVQDLMTLSEMWLFDKDFFGSACSRKSYWYLRQNSATKSSRSIWWLVSPPTLDRNHFGRQNIRKTYSHPSPTSASTAPWIPMPWIGFGRSFLLILWIKLFHNYKFKPKWRNYYLPPMSLIVVPMLLFLTHVVYLKTCQNEFIN